MMMKMIKTMITNMIIKSKNQNNDDENDKNHDNENDNENDKKLLLLTSVYGCKALIRIKSELKLGESSPPPQTNCQQL